MSKWTQMPGNQASYSLYRREQNENIAREIRVDTFSYE